MKVGRALSEIDYVQGSIQGGSRRPIFCSGIDVEESEGRGFKSTD